MQEVEAEIAKLTGLKPEYLAYGISAAATVAIAVLTGLHTAIPDILTILAAGGLTAGAGVSVPRSAR